MKSFPSLLLCDENYSLNHDCGLIVNVVFQGILGVSFAYKYSHDIHFQATHKISSYDSDYEL